MARPSILVIAVVAMCVLALSINFLYVERQATTPAPATEGEMQHDAPPATGDPFAEDGKQDMNAPNEEGDADDDNEEDEEVVTTPTPTPTATPTATPTTTPTATPSASPSPTAQPTTPADKGYFADLGPWSDTTYQDPDPFNVNLDDIVVMMTTGKKLHGTRAKTTEQTWAQYAPNFLFFSSGGPDEHVKRVYAVPGTGDTWKDANYRFMKSQELMRRKFPTKKWFLVGDDDTYISLPHLLRYLRLVDSNKPYAMGFMRYSQGFQYGGGGTFMTGAALDATRSTMLTKCVSYDQNYDMKMSRCLREAGVTMLHIDDSHSMPPVDACASKMGAGVGQHPVSFHYIKDAASMEYLSDVFTVVPMLTMMQEEERRGGQLPANREEWEPRANTYVHPQQPARVNPRSLRKLTLETVYRPHWSKWYVLAGPDEAPSSIPNHYGNWESSPGVKQYQATLPDQAQNPFVGWKPAFVKTPEDYVERPEKVGLLGVPPVLHGIGSVDPHTHSGSRRRLLMTADKKDPKREDKGTAAGTVTKVEGPTPAPTAAPTPPKEEARNRVMFVVRVSEASNDDTDTPNIRLSSTYETWMRECTSAAGYDGVWVVGSHERQDAVKEHMEHVSTVVVHDTYDELQKPKGEATVRVPLVMRTIQTLMKKHGDYDWYALMPDDTLVTCPRMLDTLNKDPDWVHAHTSPVIMGTNGMVDGWPALRRVLNADGPLLLSNELMTRLNALDLENMPDEGVNGFQRLSSEDTHDLQRVDDVEHVNFHRAVLKAGGETTRILMDDLMYAQAPEDYCTMPDLITRTGGYIHTIHAWANAHLHPERQRVLARGRKCVWELDPSEHWQCAAKEMGVADRHVQGWKWATITS